MEVDGRLLGHEDLKTTQLYAKVVDRVKDEATSRLDDIFEENDRIRRPKQPSELMKSRLRTIQIYVRSWINPKIIRISNRCI